MNSDNDRTDSPLPVLRWGILGTGFIADRMTPMIRTARNAHLQAVASRRLETAQAFAAERQIEQAFDGLDDLLAAASVDAVYVATPTATKEANALAAVAAGKHVLVDKPFESLASLQRIAAACREQGVGFMDATHFSHHPRTARIRAMLHAEVGAPLSIASAFLISMTARDNIRFDPAMEPYGAIGDIGWYCMRAAAEYLDPRVELTAADSRLFRDEATGAAVRGLGTLIFDDGSQCSWESAFRTGAGIMDLRIAGPNGAIKLDDFALQRPEDGPARFEIRHDWEDTRTEEVEAPRPEAALMFENFAAMVGDPAAREASIRISERTQRWLDAAWQAALDREAVA